MPDRTFTAEEVEDIRRQERQAQKLHDVNGQAQVMSSADILAKSVSAAVSTTMSSMLAPLLAQKPSEKDYMPAWMKVAGGLCALFISGAAVLGIVWNVAIGPVQARLDGVEKQDLAQLATVTSLSTRLAAAENKVAQIETTIATAGRIRDQQAQGVSDQVRSLLQSDQDAAKRLEQQSNIIASILPRLEEILRRQERLENRLGAQRVQPNSDEMPMALWTIPPAI